MLNELLSECLAVAADGIHAASLAAGTYTTAAVNLSQFRQLLFLVDLGTAGASATATFSLTGSATSGGSYTALGNTTATVLNTSGTYAELCVRVDQLVAANPNVAFVKGSLVIATATSVGGVMVLGALGGPEPQSQFNASTVAGIVNV